jgi:hypothetical protein
MTMKRTELEKLKGKAIENRMRSEQRPRAQPQAKGERREQRERDRTLGLVPFAIKLEAALVAELRALAAARDGDLNALAAELLRAGLAASRATS